jgi:hypothetical protein
LGVGVLVGYAIILLLLILSPIIFFIFRKNGKTKIGLLISGVIIFFCISFLFTNTIASFSFSQSDVEKDLDYANIELIEDFEILNNEVTGMPERFQKTTLKITENDKIRLIREIENGKDFDIRKSSCVFLCFEYPKELESNKSYFVNYKFNEEYVRESYFKKDDYVPIIMVVSLSLESNKLEYERIEN